MSNHNELFSSRGSERATPPHIQEALGNAQADFRAQLADPDFTAECARRGIVSQIGAQDFDPDTYWRFTAEYVQEWSDSTLAKAMAATAEYYIDQTALASNKFERGTERYKAGQDRVNQYHKLLRTAVEENPGLKPFDLWESLALGTGVASTSLQIARPQQFVAQALNDVQSNFALDQALSAAHRPAFRTDSDERLFTASNGIQINVTEIGRAHV